MTFTAPDRERHLPSVVLLHGGRLALAGPAPWALLLRGEAALQFQSGESLTITAGDPLLIPAHCRHRVDHTSPDAIYLALHYQEEPATE